MTPEQKTLHDCTQQGLKYLSMRDHNKTELSTKLKQKGYETSVINAALSSLEEEGSLDEARYVRSFVRSSNKKHPEGKTILLQRLLQKGTDRSVALEVLNEIYTPEYTAQMSSLALEHLQRKYFDPAQIRFQLSKLGLRYPTRD